MQNSVPKYTDPARSGPARDPNPTVASLSCGKLACPTGQLTDFGFAYSWRFLMRIAAFSDLHIWGPVPNWISVEFAGLHEKADVLVIAGDITNNGLMAQAERAANLLRTVQIPIVAVVGNHDRRTPRPARFRELIESSGVTFLNGTTFEVGDDVSIGFAGVQGSGGGFWPVEGPDTLPRRTAQALAVRSRREASRLDAALESLDTDVKIVVTHVSPTLTTLQTEPKFKFFLLGEQRISQGDRSPRGRPGHPRSRPSR